MRDTFTVLVNSYKEGGKLTPFEGSTALEKACMTLPSSSSTSLTQSVLPVPTRTCVLQAATRPYSTSSSSILNPLGYRAEQLSQSCKHSSPSTFGSVFTNSSEADGGLSSLAAPEPSTELTRFLNERAILCFAGGRGSQDGVAAVVEEEGL